MKETENNKLLPNSVIPPTLSDPENGYPYSRRFSNLYISDHGDAVNHPKHYNSSPSGVECIDIVKHMNFCLGNVIKYVWRADLKGEAIEDLEKAQFYLNCEISRRKEAEKMK